MRQHILETSRRFYDNITNLPNGIIGEIPDYDPTEPANRKRPWAVLPTFQ